jgi:hypothetical protein
MSRLSDDEVREVRYMYAMGWTRWAIGIAQRAAPIDVTDALIGAHPYTDVSTHGGHVGADYNPKPAWSSPRTLHTAALDREHMGSLQARGKALYWDELDYLS